MGTDKVSSSPLENFLENKIWDSAGISMTPDSFSSAGFHLNLSVSLCVFKLWLLHRHGGFGELKLKKKLHKITPQQNAGLFPLRL